MADRDNPYCFLQLFSLILLKLEVDNTIFRWAEYCDLKHRMESTYPEEFT